MSDPMDDRIKELIDGGMQPEIAVMHANEEEELGRRIKTRDELLALYEGLPWDDIERAVQTSVDVAEVFGNEGRANLSRALLARIQEARRG